MTNRLEAAQTAYQQATSRYRLLWSLGASQTLAQAQADMDAAWVHLCEVSRNEPFQHEEGSRAAWHQQVQLALDDA